MAKVFITGSTDGLGLLAARMLLSEGCDVVLHARNPQRADEAKRLLPEAKAVLMADLADMEATKRLASEVNAMGPFDAIIHNAGVYQAPKPLIFAVNVLAPYLLTALITPPKRLIYLGSNMHLQGNPDISRLCVQQGAGYSDSKLYVLMLALAVARKWPACQVYTVDPGWVPTKMGGPGAPDDLNQGAQTQVWLAHAKEVPPGGSYLFHMKPARRHERADDPSAQEQLLRLCHALSTIPFPA